MGGMRSHAFKVFTIRKFFYVYIFLLFMLRSEVLFADK